MPRITPGEDGTLLLRLEADESIRVMAGAHLLRVSVAHDGAVTASILGAAGSDSEVPAPARALPAVPEAQPEAAPPTDAPGETAAPELLSAAEAVDEILNVFQQANVKGRSVKEKHPEDSPERALAVNALKVEAMDRVAEVCQRYQLAREPVAAGQDPPRKPRRRRGARPPEAGAAASAE